MIESKSVCGYIWSMMWQHLLAQIWVIFYENSFGGTLKICSSENQQEFDERHGLSMKDNLVCSACPTGYNNRCVCRLSVRQGLWVGHRLGKPEGGSLNRCRKVESRGSGGGERKWGSQEGVPLTGTTSQRSECQVESHINTGE